MQPSVSDDYNLMTVGCRSRDYTVY